jgi:hypothetical protein
LLFTSATIKHTLGKIVWIEQKTEALLFILATIKHALGKVFLIEQETDVDVNQLDRKWHLIPWKK